MPKELNSNFDLFEKKSISLKNSPRKNIENNTKNINIIYNKENEVEDLKNQLKEKNEFIKMLINEKNNLKEKVKFINYVIYMLINLFSR